jgi:hypothetical protein
MEEITQDTATLALMMEREVDKRVVLALMRMLDPTSNEFMLNANLKIAEQTMDEGNRARTQQMVAGLLVNVLLNDGSLMHNIRSKLAEQLNRGY